MASRRMLNCRSVSPSSWEHARQALVFYFSRRHGLSHAEDLAHETLAALLGRGDFQFEKEEDFLRVCYGFASHILQAARREASRTTNDGVEAAGARMAKAQGLADAELQVYLAEVLAVGRQQLRESDWRLIRRSMAPGGGEAGSPDCQASANNNRVKLHRARRKLAQLVGWRKV